MCWRSCWSSDRRGLAVPPAGLGISRTSCRRPCGDRELSRRQRPDRDQHGRPADRERRSTASTSMLYMESTSAPDGTYILTVTFEIGTDPNIDQVLVQNRVQLALASLPEPVQAQGVSVQKKNTAILQIVTLEFARRQVRQPVHEQLRDHQPGRRAGAPAGRRQRQGVRRRHILHADLDGPAEAAVLRPRSRRTSIDAIRQQSQNVAAGQVGMPPAPKRHRVPVYRRHPVAARTSRSNSPTSSSRTRPRRAAA